MNAVYLIVGAFAVMSALYDLHHPNALMVGALGVVMIVAAVAATVESTMPLTQTEARRRANLLRGQWVRMTRTSRKMTQTQLAAQLGLRKEQVAQAEDEGLTQRATKPYEAALGEPCPAIKPSARRPRDPQDVAYLTGLRAVWKAKKWNMDEATRGIMTRPTLNNWLHGSHKPSAQTLESLCERIGAKPERVLKLGKAILSLAGGEPAPAPQAQAEAPPGSALQEAPAPSLEGAGG